MDRRYFLTASTALLAAPALIGRAVAAEGGRPLPMLAVMDVDATGGNDLTARTATHQFLSGATTPVLGFGGAYLGPILRMKRGQTARPVVHNTLDIPITTHWHGLHVPGAMDGGPQGAIAPGDTWSPQLDIDQPAATYWYHSHVHRQTATQVYRGLAGLLLIEDPDAPDPGLPSTLGKDDLPLVVQDRAFSDNGQLYYSNSGPDGMTGFRADQIVVNGAIRPVAEVPKGLVRLRLLNASNARIYDFRFEDNRSFHQVTSDAGLLAAPIALNHIRLAPAERVEIVVDFTDPASVRLLSAPDTNSPMGGIMNFFMGGGQSSPKAVNRKDEFEIMTFNVSTRDVAAVQTLPSTLAGAPTATMGEPVRRRRFDLNIHGAGMMGGMMGGDGASMTINGKPMDLNVINQEVRLGDTELWHITSSRMAHPFHVHGTSFQVVKINGAPVDPTQIGLKDVVLVNGSAEVLINFTKKADAQKPFMYHCHILEHEDAGMMGQFTVS